MDRRAHWDQVYRSKTDAEMSWFQAEPATSLALIMEAAPDRTGRIIDVGGGTAALPRRLLEEGYSRITVVDVSEAALERARAAMGARAGEIQWRCVDFATGPNLGAAEAWHDRAAFHFLVAAEDRREYVDTAARTIVPGGRLIVGTFALDGPAACSGLPVQRYDAEGLAAEFAPAFVLKKSVREVHTTPWGKAQAFVFAVLERAQN